MSDSTVAGIIKQQVGVWAFAEVGARGFMYDDKSLHFDCKPLHRIVRVRITLDPSDTYTVTVLNKKGDTIYDQEGMYFDSLPSIVRNLAKLV